MELLLKREANSCLGTPQNAAVAGEAVRAKHKAVREIVFFIIMDGFLELLQIRMLSGL